MKSHLPAGLIASFTVICFCFFYLGRESSDSVTEASVAAQTDERKAAPLIQHTPASAQLEAAPPAADTTSNNTAPLMSEPVQGLISAGDTAILEHEPEILELVTEEPLMELSAELNRALAEKESNLQARFRAKEDDGNGFDDAQRLIDLVATSERMANYALADAQCHADTCKLSFHVADQSQSAQLMDDLLHSLVEERGELNVMYDGPSAEGYATVYVGNAGSSFYRNAAKQAEQ